MGITHQDKYEVLFMITSDNFPVSIATLLQQLEQKKRAFIHLVEAIGLDLKQVQIDHLALRTNHQSQADKWRAVFCQNAKILSQNQVNGRPIYLFKLDQAIDFCQQLIDIVELPYPNDKTYPEEGWEHFEVVLPFLPDETIFEWQQRIDTLFQLTEKEYLCFKVSQPKVMGEQLPNPSIAIRFNPLTIEKSKFKQGADLNLCIKIHPYSIEQVVQAE
ncbi:metalloprotein [Mergibacter septicus]|nr:metalloprotein [Mergibacter septicus]